MAAKKCKCGRKLILEMDKVRGTAAYFLDPKRRLARCTFVQPVALDPSKSPNTNTVQRSLWLSESNAGREEHADK